MHSSTPAALNAMRTTLTALGLVLGAFNLQAKDVVTPFAGSPDYLTRGEVYGISKGAFRTVLTSYFEGSPAVALRELSVRPESQFNRNTVRDYPDQIGTRPLPPVFGGYSAVVYQMKEPTSFTSRAQIRDGGSKTKDDYFCYHVYVESDQPQPPGLEFSFNAAWLFPAGNEGSTQVVSLDRIAEVSFTSHSQRPVDRVMRVLVRDADSGIFYVSQRTSSENDSFIRIAGDRWARLDSTDLSVISDYKPAAFDRVDHIGVYVSIPVTKITQTLSSHGMICNISLHHLDYTLLP